MSKIAANRFYGFETEDIHLGYRSYDLASSQLLVVGSTGLAEVYLADASNHTTADHDKFFRILDYSRDRGLELIVAVDAQFNGEYNGEYPKKAEKRLAQRLKPHKKIVKPVFKTKFCGEFDEPGFVQLLTQCKEPRNLSSFLESCLEITVMEARNSKRGRQPNYFIDTGKLREDIEKYIDRELNWENLPERIEGYSRLRSPFPKLSDTKYAQAIVQVNGSSFTYNQEMEKLARRLTKGASGSFERSLAIFNWIIGNVAYGKEQRKLGSYRGALETYNSREGVCGETAALQVTLERLAGNTAFLAEVGTDHVCAAHLEPDGKVILIDTTTPNGFGLQSLPEYKQFQVLTDEHSLAKSNY